MLLPLDSRNAFSAGMQVCAPVTPARTIKGFIRKIHRPITMLTSDATILKIFPHFPLDRV